MHKEGTVVAIIQARMSSKRLPGKVLEPILGRPMILHQLERAARADLDRVIVATSVEAADDELARVVEQAGYACERGALDDVLARFHGAAMAAQAAHVVRLTADCPLVDHRIVDALVRLHVAAGNDYTSNTLQRTYPDGLDVEVMTMGALTRASAEARLPAEREHVTPYIYGHPESFKLGGLEHSENLARYRWTVDYPEDLEVIRAVFADLAGSAPDFSMQDVLALFALRPELAAINAGVNPLHAHGAGPTGTSIRHR